MTQVATVLIVMTLTGGPVARAVCVSWCDWSSAPDCGMSSGETAFVSMFSENDTCGALLSDRPFVTEEGWTTSQPTSLVRFHSPGHAVAARTTAIPIAIDGYPIDGRPVLALVLRV
jgi:hypothetical protein